MEAKRFDESPVYWVDGNHFQRLAASLETESPHLKTVKTLSELAACLRINALSTIYHANHGWIGASLSCADLLTALYFRIMRHRTGGHEGDLLLLGKGHAAAAQYAALAGVGEIPTTELAKYKMPDGPQAHPDLSTAGIHCNSGSLGQVLSKAFGLGWRYPGTVYAILGDGELQEGQIYEAFSSICHHRLCNVIPIIDRNGIQSDSATADVKRIPGLESVLAGFGFHVVHIPDGNNMEQVLVDFESIREARSEPVAVIADTRKGAGISFMSAKSVPRRGYEWHGKIPDPTQYFDALHELSSHIHDPEIHADLERFLSTLRGRRQASPTGTAKSAANGELPAVSTGMRFGQALVEFGETESRLVVLDADLEKPCRLTAFAKRFPDRFIELGIAEQDMVSVGGGLALQGFLPVVNTYGSFFRRAYEQIYVNATEHTRILYAGHYSGLCYTTDGKTHQTTGDVAMMRALPEIEVLYPAFPEEIPGILEWFLAPEQRHSAYLRLHRSPMLCPFDYESAAIRFSFGRGISLREPVGCRIAMVTSGPHMVSFCVAAHESLKAGGEPAPGVVSVSTLRSLAPEFVRKLASEYDALFIIEELIRTGGLFDEIAGALAGIGGRHPKIPVLRHHAADQFPFSDRDPLGLYRAFRLTPAAIAEFCRNELIS